MPEGLQKGEHMEIRETHSGYAGISYAYKKRTNKEEGKNPPNTSNVGTSDDQKEVEKRISDKINEILTKIKNGETEPSFQIGAKSYTQKEWDKLLERFDSIEENIRESMREEQEKLKEQDKLKQIDKKKQLEKKEISNEITNSDLDNTIDLLVAESTKCSCPASNPEDEEDQYIIWYTKEGIFCKKIGDTAEFEWSISFENTDQYDDVIEFIGQYSADKNLSFAADESFWTNFLNGEIDKESFIKSFESIKTDE